jgi:glutamate synthase (NADPH/NADH) large chain
MTGGIAYVLDEAGDFDLRCNLETVDLEPIDPDGDAEAELLALLRLHAEETGSSRARDILADWENYRPRFIRVFPEEYRRALESSAR